MKKRISFFIICIIAFNNFLVGQAKLPPGLNLGNRGTMTFQEMKTTINNYYTNIATTSRDSLEVKRSRRQLKMWNREFWLSENYLNAEGKIEDANKKIIEALNKEQREKEPGYSSLQSSFWVQNGPTSCSFSIDAGEGMGRVDKIAFHPTNLSIIFAGTPHGGLFKSTDAGGSWSPISAFIPTLGISGIAIHPTNADIIYILSGDGNSSDNGFVDKYLYRSSCTGVYKTTNGGDTWLKVADFDTNAEPYRGRELIIDPSNPNVLFAATSKGLFRTIDGGDTWVLRSSNSNIWDVKFKPGNSQTVYYVTKDEFFHSENGGNIFQETIISNIQTATRISMAVSPANSSRVMLFAGKSNAPNDDEFVGIFRSNNSGLDFSRIYSDQNLFNNYIDLDVTAGQVNYNNTIAIHPNDANIVLVGGLCVWSSHDGGLTWEQETAYHAPSDILNEYIHPDVHHLAFNSNGTLYCGNDGGVYKSYDDGDDWDFMSVGLTATQFYHFEKENDEGDTWGGAQDNGILERESGGGFYMYWAGDGYDMMTDHPYLVADGEGDDIYYTTNNHIRGDGSDISVPGNNSFFGNLAMSPVYEDVIYVGYEQAVYRSDDAGGDWTNLGGNIPGNWDISTCPSFHGRIYAAGVNGSFAGGIRKREDGDWTGLTTALYDAGYISSQKITGIEVHQNSSDRVYISCAGFIPNSKVYYTANGGSNWENWSFNLPNVPVFSIKRDAYGGLYVGTSIGVYYKRNNVNYWEPFSNGLPAVPVTQIELFATTQQVMISTFGRGLWTAPFYISACPDDLTLTTSPYGNYYREANISITSTQNISQTTGTNVKYNAGTTIVLMPGFTAPSGTNFKTFLTGCGGEVDH